MSAELLEATPHAISGVSIAAGAVVRAPPPVRLCGGNTNTNSRKDIAAVREVMEQSSGRLDDMLLGQSPGEQDSSSSTYSSRSPSPADSVGPSAMEPSPFPHGSPISGDLPSMAISTAITSPSLGFELPHPPHENENGGPSLPHSPGIPTHAHYQTKSSSPDHGIMLSPSTSDISPTSLLTPTQTLFQHILDTRAPLNLSSNVLLPQNVVAFAGSDNGEDDEEDPERSRICLWNNCRQQFPNLQSLVTHLDREHTLSMLKYICFWKDCTRSMKPFDARYKLITHLRCHTGEKPYKCTVQSCNRSFSRLENLKLHIRTHTGEKPYVCHYEGCNKRFNNTSDRAKHMKTHITRKPYACKYPGCGKSYTDPSSMRKHIKFAHKLKEEGSSMADHNGANKRRSSRKSSSTSTDPTSPLTPSSVVLHRTSIESPGAMTISPPPSASRVSPIIHSPPAASANPATVVTTTVANPGTSLVSLPFFQFPGQSSSAPVGGLQQGSMQPLIVQTGSSQQPVFVLLPGNRPEQQQQQNLIQKVLQQQLALSQPVKILQSMENGRDGAVTENQLCLQIAQLQQQQQQQTKAVSVASGVTGTSTAILNNSISTEVSSPKRLAIVTTVASPQAVPQIFSVIQSPLSGQNQPVAFQQPQIASVQGSPLVSGLLPSQLASLVPSPSVQLASVAQNHSQFTKPITVLNPQQVLGVTPGRAVTQYIIPQFMVPGTQSQPLVMSLVPAQGVTPQIGLVPQSQSSKP